MYVFLLSLALCVGSIWSQELSSRESRNSLNTPPEWVRNLGTTSRYPADEYYVGFGYHRGVYSEAIERASAKAQGALSRSIVLQIQTRYLEVIGEEDRRYQSRVNSITETRSNLRLEGVQLEKYNGSSHLGLGTDTVEIYVLSYISKKELKKNLLYRQQYYLKRIQGLFANIEKSLNYGKKGYKKHKVTLWKYSTTLRECIEELENIESILLATGVPLEQLETWSPSSWQGEWSALKLSIDEVLNDNIKSIQDIALSVLHQISQNTPKETLENSVIGVSPFYAKNADWMGRNMNRRIQKELKLLLSENPLYRVTSNMSHATLMLGGEWWLEGETLHWGVYLKKVQEPIIVASARYVFDKDIWENWQEGEWYSKGPSVTGKQGGTPSSSNISKSHPRYSNKRKKWKVRKGSPGMMHLPGGCFLMGSPRSGTDEHPQHEVCLDAFEMDKTEVTQEQFQKTMSGALLGSLDSEKETCWNCPVDEVNWYEAKEYCSLVGKRLPTEAEWEYAARAGTNTAYYWGSGEEPLYVGRKNPHIKYYGTLYPVGTTKPNPWGLFDMSGNVWEWVSDWYNARYYKNSPRENPEGPQRGVYRVLRGGAWHNNDDSLRSANRYGSSPKTRYSGHGFRCARSVKGL